MRRGKRGGWRRLEVLQISHSVRFRIQALGRTGVCGYQRVGYGIVDLFSGLR